MTMKTAQASGVVDPTMMMMMVAGNGGSSMNAANAGAGFGLGFGFGLHHQSFPQMWNPQQLEMMQKLQEQQMKGLVYSPTEEQEIEDDEEENEQEQEQEQEEEEDEDEENIAAAETQLHELLSIDENRGKLGIVNEVLANSLWYLALVSKKRRKELRTLLRCPTLTPSSAFLSTLYLFSLEAADSEMKSHLESCFPGIDTIEKRHASRDVLRSELLQLTCWASQN